MDPHRPNRVVIDPKVRQVGFVTPIGPHLTTPSRTNSVSPPTATSPDDISESSTLLSPVIIPPPRHNSAPVPVPPHSPPLRRSNAITSYSNSDGSTSNMEAFVMSVSWSSRMELEYDDVAWGERGKSSGSSSFPGRSGEMMKVDGGTGIGNVKAAVNCGSMAVSTVPVINEKDGDALIEMQNKGDESLKPAIQKLTRADRRAIQEAQRAAKAASKESDGGGKSSKGVKYVNQPSPKKEAAQTSATSTSEKKASDRYPEKDRKKDAPPPRMQYDDKHRVEKAKRRAVVNRFEARNRVELFRHLPQYVHGTQLPDLESKFFQLEPMHPSVYKVGLQYLWGDISGGNARCIAMLLAFREAIDDYTTPPKKLFIRDLTAKINSYVSFFTECRHLSISMGNAIKFLKNRIATVPDSFSEFEKKYSLKSDIDQFINDKIILADKVIVGHAVTKIRDGDVLLAYGSSTVVEMILLHAHELGKHFRVVIVDSRPKLEARALLHRLVAKGLSCTYTHINALSYIMHEVTRVFLGASSVLSNGTVYSRVGTASVAMVAHAFNVPVLICCEAYKFHERVLLDSVCSNELGDPDVISKVPGQQDANHLKCWADDENLQYLNLSYDATPSDYVSLIITDYGMLPPTSVPVILREHRREHVWI